MSQRPSTPVKVPSSAANYTPATLDPDLRSQINTLLLRDGHITKYVSKHLLFQLVLQPSLAWNKLENPPKLTSPWRPACRIQESLLHALNSHSTNWPTTIQSHALALLRSGEVTTFPALLRRVLDDITADSPSTGTKGAANGKAATNGDKKVNGAAAADATGKSSLAVPESVVEEALRVTRESLEAVCEVEENGVM
jgi:hypothetical protein